MVNYVTGATYLDQVGASGTPSAGTYGIYGGGTTWPGRRVRDVSNKIWLLDAQNTALTTLLRNIRKKRVTDPKYEWFEDEFNEQTTTGTADDSTTTDTSIAVTHGSRGRPGDVWLNNDNDELVYIDDVSSNTWTLVRGVGGTTAADWDADDKLFYIGNAQPTGSTARQPLTTVTVPQYNYCQIFKEDFEIAKTADATKLYGGPQRQYLRQKHGIQHTRDIERAFWFGGRGQVTSTQASTHMGTSGVGGGLVYLTGGVFEKITTNTNTDTSGLTNMEFELILEQYMRYGPSTKFLFASPRACTVIDKWGRDVIQTVPSDSTFGIAIKRYQSSHGNINIIQNKLFYDFANTSSDTRDYSHAAALLDLEMLTYVYMRDTQLAMGIQENDRDSVEDQYLTECGLMMKQQRHHGEIFGFTYT